MTEHLFVYGTLLPGSAPDESAAAAAQLRPVAQGTVAGRLYHLGHFPGAVLDAGSGQRVFGTVFALPQDPACLCALLRSLDEYEEFDSAAPAKSQFVRTRTLVSIDGGTTLDCWIYVYNRNVEGIPIIAAGRWNLP